MKKGNVSVEALISVSVFLLFMFFLMQVILGFASESIVAQNVLDGLEDLENYNIAIETIGISNELDSLLSDNLSQWLDEEIYIYMTDLLSKGLDNSRSDYLETLFKSMVETSDTVVQDFSVKEDLVTVEVIYEKNYLFGLETKSILTAEKKLFLYGDDSDLYKKHSLIELIKETVLSEEGKFVYKTKTGSKYHLRDCFYINRSTTDQTSIQKISIYEAKYIYYLLPCKRCIGGQNEGW